MELIITYVGIDILLDYTGMNPLSAKVFGFSPIKDDEILILKGMSDDKTKETIKHEQIEYGLLKDGKLYWEAHRIALQNEAKSMNKVIKHFTTSKSNDGEVMITTPNFDRGNDRVFPEGVMTDNYEKNPVIMWIHDYAGRTESAGLPIAKCPYLKVTPQGIISGAPQFLDGDAFAQKVKNAWDKGFIKTVSIGFAPIEYETNEKGGTDYKKWEMLEYSLSPIPMNAEAMRIAKSIGCEDLIDKSTKPEVISQINDFREAIANAEIVDLTDHAKKPMSQAEIKDELDYVLLILQENTLDLECQRIMAEIVRITGGDTPDKISEILNALDKAHEYFGGK